VILIFWVLLLSAAFPGTVGAFLSGDASVGAVPGVTPVLRVLFCGNSRGELFPCPS